MSVVLICGAALLFKSLAQLQQVDVGARIDRVITMAIDLPYARYPSGNHLAAFYPVLIDRLRAVPGVTDASISGDVPLEGTGGENLLVPGRENRVLVRFKRADTGYFSTLGIGVSPVAASRRAIASARRMSRRQRGAGRAAARSIRHSPIRSGKSSTCRRWALAATAAPR